ADELTNYPTQTLLDDALRYLASREEVGEKQALLDAVGLTPAGKHLIDNSHLQPVLLSPPSRDAEVESLTVDWVSWADERNVKWRTYSIQQRPRTTDDLISYLEFLKRLLEVYGYNKARVDALESVLAIDELKALPGFGDNETPIKAAVEAYRAEKSPQRRDV